jgi:truncated hemoglobin YjbI/quinol monooxygenase YgiN
MIVEYIRYRLTEDRVEGFEAAYSTAALGLSLSPQCVDYELSRSVDEPLCYIPRITWTSSKDHLDGFRGSALFPPFFAAVKPYFSDVEEMRHYDRTHVRGRGASVPTLFEWAGSAPALEKLSETFYKLVRKDELIGPLFAHMDCRHPHFVALSLGEVLGGPADYSSERGGYVHMLDHHLGKAITEQQRRRWVALLMDAADESGLPNDPEFRAAFTGCIEWGSRLAQLNSQLDAEPVKAAPVPRWGWGVAPPHTS